MLVDCRRWVAAVAFLAALNGACDSHRTRAAAARDAPSTAESATEGDRSVPGDSLAVNVVAGGFGGVGPATPAPYPDVWIVVFIDVDSSVPLAGLSIDMLEVRDEGGNVVARAQAPWSVRTDTGLVPDADRRRGNFSDVGTTPFDGTVPSGRVRLRVHAPLDTRAESLKPLPVRFRARVVARGIPGAWIDGPLQGPWATG